MPRIILFATALAALFAGAAAALADDAETIAACLATESKADRPLADCVGRVADPCAETPEGQSTVGQSACAFKEEKIWDGVLNQEYGALLKLLKPEAAEDVRKAQRIWLTLRDADCRVPYYFYEGGTIVQILGARCQLEHTADRAILMRSWHAMARGEE